MFAAFVRNKLYIEAAQRKYTKRISRMSELTYYSRLKTLNLERLELRGIRADLILVCKTSLRFIWCDEWSVFYSQCPTTIIARTSI